MDNYGDLLGNNNNTKKDEKSSVLEVVKPKKGKVGRKVVSSNKRRTINLPIAVSETEKSWVSEQVSNIEKLLGTKVSTSNFIRQKVFNDKKIDLSKMKASSKKEKKDKSLPFSVNSDEREAIKQSAKALGDEIGIELNVSAYLRLKLFIDMPREEK
ncbi:hypothetical protein ALC152_04920 [Arcobacter sp. 15-2]|uniref:hypothetical protein n=1 Tax=Arcobacter sp. 15-2 TaxID=3374109 RepID=UPI00399C83EC